MNRDDMLSNNDILKEPPYDFEIEKIADVILRGGYKKILIQMPDGLKIYSKYIRDEIVKRVGNVEIVFSGDSAWGSCLLDDVEAARGGYDLLVHIGHIEYPYYKSSHRTLFIPAYSRLSISEDLISKLFDALDLYKINSVGVVSTIQHIKLLPEVLKVLSTRYKVFKGSGLGAVMGCEYSSAIAISRYVDAYVIISGGVFHGLGLGLSVLGKPVIKLDPYESKVVDLTKEIDKILRIRIHKIHEASEARNWVLIDGVKGQNRSWFRRYLEHLIKSRGGDYIVYVSENITKDLLINIDSSWVDAYIILACPRIPIDDLYDFYKPVLTPAEARMILTGKKDRYYFPW
jgi:2-(3-amino-3-carboxypropyl)histidine synthase